MGKAARGWVGWVFFSHDMDFIHWHSHSLQAVFPGSLERTWRMGYVSD